MRNIFIILLLLIIFISCTETNKDIEADYRFEIQSDTVLIGQLYVAKICFREGIDIERPLVYIIVQNDSIYLPFDSKQNCAIYQGIGKYEGEKKWSGTIEYLKQGKKYKNKFERTYYVVPRPE